MMKVNLLALSIIASVIFTSHANAGARENAIENMAAVAVASDECGFIANAQMMTIVLAAVGLNVDDLKSGGNYGADFDHWVGRAYALARNNRQSFCNNIGRDLSAMFNSTPIKPKAAARPVVKPAPKPVQPAKPKGDRKVIELQRELVRLGYVVGMVDGLYGAKSLAAVRAFKQDTGLAVDEKNIQQLADSAHLYRTNRPKFNMLINTARNLERQARQQTETVRTPVAASPDKFYLKAMGRRVSNNWNRPDGINKSNFHCLVSLTKSSAGLVRSVQKPRCFGFTGNEKVLSDSVINAVIRSSPLPSPTTGANPNSIQILFSPPIKSVAG